MLVLVDTIVNRKEINRWQNAAPQKIGGSESFEIVFTQAGLDLMQRLDGCSRSLRAQPAITRNFGLA